MTYVRNPQYWAPFALVCFIFGISSAKDGVPPCDSNSNIVAAATGACQPQWVPTFGGAPGTNGTISALAVFDDDPECGEGPALYVGGSFWTAGGVSANRIAKWNGSSWSPLGSGTNGSVSALVTHDDGSSGGPALYAGGSFTIAGGISANNLAKWNGTSWSPVGTGMSTSVSALKVFDDGSGDGPALYAGGYFIMAGGVSANRIAKWNGSSWSALGTGMNKKVSTLAVFDDGLGGGPALYAGGEFLTAGGVSANFIAKWNGTSWSSLGTGMSGVGLFAVNTLAVFDDGSGTGPALYAGGSFIGAGGVTVNRIAKWNGASWSPLGTGMNGEVNSLVVFDDGLGGGPALYAGGKFTSAGDVSANRIAKWNGSSWSAVGTGMSDQSTSVNVSSFAVFDDDSGDGPALYAGGYFTFTDNLTVNGLAKWNGASLSPVGTGLSAAVFAIKHFDDGQGGGPALYAGGYFTTAGGGSANHIAKWDGTSWSPLGTGIGGHVYAITAFDDGAGGGPALYAAGNFTSAGGATTNRIAKWDGSSWWPVGTGTNGTILDLVVFDDGLGDGPALYAGGVFTTAGGVNANYVAKWNGRSWSPLGTGMNDWVRAITVFDDGSGDGPALYVGGQFTSADGANANYIAKWDGSTWSPLNSGLNSWVVALTVSNYNSDEGPALYAGGCFTTAGGVSANCIAKWNGSAWSSLGTGMNTCVHALASLDEGTAPSIYAGGSFSTAGGVSAIGIARWNGTTWSPLETGVGGTSPFVQVLSAFDDGSGTGPALYVGGNFRVSPGGDSFLAKWQGCPAPQCQPADITCDGVVNLADLLTVINSWGACPASPSICPADISPPPYGDGVVNVGDLLMVINNWS